MPKELPPLIELLTATEFDDPEDQTEFDAFLDEMEELARSLPPAEEPTEEPAA